MSYRFVKNGNLDSLRSHVPNNVLETNQKLDKLWRDRSERLGVEIAKAYGRANAHPLIIFVHIAKTAGSTFLLTLQKNYEESLIYNISDEASFLEDCKAFPILEQLRVVTGHGSFHLRIDRRTKRDCCFLTILRDPVERIVSLYYYLLSIADVSDAGRMMMETKMSLKEFIQYKENQVTDNSMMRMLCNTEGKTAKWGECTEKMLEDAKYNLINYFDFVGFTDEYASFSQQVCSFFGWEASSEVSNVNKDRVRTDELDSDLIGLIKEINHFDYKLYDFAKEHFSLRTRK